MLLTNSYTYLFVFLSFNMISHQLRFGIKKHIQGNQGEFKFVILFLSTLMFSGKIIHVT
jgi:hypothetical protein